MKTYLRWIALIALLALAGLACQLTSWMGPSSSGEILFRDDFSDPASGWPQGEDDTGVAEYKNSGFRIYVATDLSGKLSTLHLQPFTDVRIEVEAAKIAGPDDNDYGIVCRFVDENNFYFFEISSDGYYGIGKYKNNNLSLISAYQMQSSDTIHQGASTNHLRADCVGSELTLYVNGTRLVQVSDSDFGSGNVGLIAGTFETPGTDVLFDNFMVMKP